MEEVICAELLFKIFDVTPESLNTIEVAPARFVPLITTFIVAPWRPYAGVIAVMVG
jgi:hypothetical protein